MSIFEKSRQDSFFKTNPVNGVMAILVTLVFLITITGDQQFYFNRFALHGYWVLEMGEWWRMITVMFLHGGIMHYAFNTFFGLYVIGSALERLIGPLRYFVVFFIGGLLASGAVVLWDLMGDFEGPPTVGASGAIFAVLGMLLYITINRPQWLTPRDASTIKGFVFLNVVFTFLAPNISIPGHIGGLIAGYLIGLIMSPKKPHSPHGSSDFSDPYEYGYIDPGSLDDIDEVEDEDEDDEDPFARYDKNDF